MLEWGMSDAEKVEAPPSPSSPSQSQPRPLWVRIKPLFAAHRVTAAFTVVLALSTLALVITAYFQHIDAVDAIEASKRLAIATENAVTDRRQTASAELILRIDTMLEERRYDRITDDIQSHDSNYHLPKYKDRADAEVEEYTSVFEDMRYFIKDNLISTKMAYDHFSYDIEKHGATLMFNKLYERRERLTKERPHKATRCMGISKG
jgi:hypothetical protein